MPVDGEQWLLKVKDRNYGLKWAVAMKDKSAKSVLKALRICISKIRLMASAANQQVVRIQCHADYDKSYEAEVKQYIEEQPWLGTRTQGYDHGGNAAVERDIKMMRGHNRTLLLEVTGGRLQYRELTVQAALHSTKLSNYLSHAGKETPVQKAGGRKIGVLENVQIFGSRAVAYLPKDLQQGAEQPSTRQCIYLGMADEVGNGQRLI